MCGSDTCVICLSNAKFKRLSPSRALAIQKIRNNANLPEMGERLKCGHIFHRKCILPWFLNLDSENSYNCPMCRGDIVFSNNLGMRNDFLFERKYELAYKKAVEEGYFDEEEDGYDMDDDDSQEDEGYNDDYYDDDDDTEISDYDSDLDDDSQDAYDDNSGTHDLRHYLTHEGDLDDYDDQTDFNNERRRFDEENERNVVVSSNSYSMLVSYRCEMQMCRNALEYLTQPKIERYAFRPHPCGHVH
jgi:hypothetical protein